MTRALVTGCAGFIGSHLCEALLEDGVSVVGVDCFNSNYGRQQKLRNLERAKDWDDFEDLKSIPDGISGIVPGQEAVDRVLRKLLKTDAKILWVNPIRPSLETLFQRKP